MPQECVLCAAGTSDMARLGDGSGRVRGFVRGADVGHGRRLVSIHRVGRIRSRSSVVKVR
jgi:hypothetical protein